MPLCDNDFPSGYEAARQIKAAGLAMTQQTQKLIGLLLLMFLLAWVCFLTFRAYLGADFLIGFGNPFVC